MTLLRTLAPAAALALLTACGSSQKANDAATADTVEMPAEEAMGEATAMPSDMVGEPTDLATDEAPAPAAAATGAE